MKIKFGRRGGGGPVEAGVERDTSRVAVDASALTNFRRVSFAVVADSTSETVLCVMLNRLRSKIYSDFCQACLSTSRSLGLPVIHRE